MQVIRLITAFEFTLLIGASTTARGQAGGKATRWTRHAIKIETDISRTWGTRYRRFNNARTEKCAHVSLTR